MEEQKKNLLQQLILFKLITRLRQNYLASGMKYATGGIQKIVGEVKNDKIVLHLPIEFKYREFGRAPRILKAKNKKFLKFPKENAEPSGVHLEDNQVFEKDGFIFAKKVFQLEVMPNPVVRQTLHQDMPEIIQSSVEEVYG